MFLLLGFQIDVDIELFPEENDLDKQLALQRAMNSRHYNINFLPVSHWSPQTIRLEQ